MAPQAPACIGYSSTSAHPGSVYDPRSLSRAGPALPARFPIDWFRARSPGAGFCRRGPGHHDAMASDTATKNAPRADYAPEGTDAAPLAVRDREAHLHGVQRGQHDRLGGGAHLLRPALPLPRPDRARVDHRARRQIPRRSRRTSRTSSPTLGPSSAADTFAGPIKSITANKSAAGILLIVSLAAALWSASGYVGRVHAGLEHHLRDARGPADLEAAPAADPRDARDDHPDGDRRARPRPHRDRS